MVRGVTGTSELRAYTASYDKCGQMLRRPWRARESTCGPSLFKKGNTLPSNLIWLRKQQDWPPLCWVLQQPESVKYLRDAFMSCHQLSRSLCAAEAALETKQQSCKDCAESQGSTVSHPRGT